MNIFLFGVDITKLRQSFLIFNAFEQKIKEFIPIKKLSFFRSKNFFLSNYQPL